MNQPAAIHSQSFAFAQDELMLARRRAHVAIRHLDAVAKVDVPELRKLAHQTAETAVVGFRRALGKRNFEIRQLL